MTAVRLSALVVALESGARPKGGVSADTGEILSLGAEHVSDDGGLDLTAPKCIPRAFFESMNSGHVRRADILIVKDGATTGKVAFLNQGHPLEAAVNEHVFRIAVDESRAVPAYVFHFLRSPQGQSQILSDFRGATVGGISRGFVERVTLPLPPLADQRRIAAVLDKADGIRRKRRESLRLLDEFLRSAYSAVVGPANQGYLTWPEAQVADLADGGPESMRTGPFGSSLRHSEFVDSGMAVLGIDNAVQNRFAWDERRFITQEKYEKFKRYTVKPGDVIVTIMGTTGRSAVVPADIPLAISTKHLAVITPDCDKVHAAFLSYAIHSDPTVLAQIAAASRGAIMAGLNLGIIKRLHLRVPPMSAQRRFAELVDRVSYLRDRLTLAANETTRLFDSLMQRAFAPGPQLEMADR